MFMFAYCPLPPLEGKPRRAGTGSPKQVLNKGVLNDWTEAGASGAVLSGCKRLWGRRYRGIYDVTLHQGHEEGSASSQCQLGL